MRRRDFLGTLATGSALLGARVPAAAEPAFALENDRLRYVVDAEGVVREFADARSRRNYLAPPRDAAANRFLSLRQGGKLHFPTLCRRHGDIIETEFGTAPASVHCRFAIRPDYFVFEVLAVRGDGIEAIELCRLALRLTDHVGTMAVCAWNDQFAAAVVALDLRVNAGAQSGSSALLWARAYPRLGSGPARIALLGCAAADLRPCLQRVVREQRLPQSAVGGAWALDAPETHHSYLFSFAGEQDVGDWLDLARRAGMRELLLSEIGPYGHYDPYPRRFPRGWAGVREVVAKIHAAGIAAGWHMLAFTIQKNDPWVTPVPDPRLAVRGTLALAAPISATAATVPTRESPASWPRRSGFWVRGGQDVLVEQEILTYAGLGTSPPYALTGCRRGAYGTHPAVHAAGAELQNLQEVFGTYVPAADSTLFEEMQERIAEAVNFCAFDKIYMDGLDGADVFDGAEWAWHYGPKFALGVFGRVRRRLRFEASAWFHHDWHITSQLGAWDFPRRGPRSFVDLHIAANRSLDDLLPAQLGWWALLAGQGDRVRPTTTQDMEYLAAKCLGNDMALSLEKLAPEDLARHPTWPELLATIRAFEDLRQAGVVSKEAKARLREPGVGFSVRRGAAGVSFEPWRERSWCLEVSAAAVARVRLLHRDAPQAPLLRLRGLPAVAAADDAGAVAVEDFNHPEDFERRRAAPGIRGDLRRGLLDGRPCAILSAESRRRERRGAWLQVGCDFLAPRDLSRTPALGLWVHGDGQGELLNLQLVDTRGPDVAVSEHYLAVDFTGWRQCALLEAQARRWNDFAWPYTNPMAVYRELVDEARVAALNVYLNDISAGGASCGLADLYALATTPATLWHTRLTLRGRTVEIPAPLPTGACLEILPSGQVRSCDGNDAPAVGFSLPRPLPELVPGENEISVTANVTGAPRGRLELSIVTAGERFAA